MAKALVTIDSGITAVSALEASATARSKPAIFWKRLTTRSTNSGRSQNVSVRITRSRLRRRSVAVDRHVSHSTACCHSGCDDTASTACALVKATQSNVARPRSASRRGCGSSGGAIAMVGHDIDSSPRRRSARASGPSGPSSRVFATIGRWPVTTCSPRARRARAVPDEWRSGSRAHQHPTNRGRVPLPDPAHAEAMRPARSRGV